MTAARAPRTISRASRVAMPVALAAATVWLGVLALSGDAWRPGALVGGAALGAATLASMTRGLVAQVFARAVGWLTFIPSAVAVMTMLAMREAPVTALPFAAASGAALWAGLPLLETREAYEPFAPVRFRRAWIAAATSAIAMALVLGLGAAQTFRHGDVLGSVGPASLALGLLSSAIAVLRMRAVGVLLGGATALASLIAAAFATGGGALALALVALPGALLVAPVLLSRLIPGEATAARGARTRFTDEAPLDHAAPRGASLGVRVIDATASSPVYDEVEVEVEAEADVLAPGARATSTR